MYLCTYTCISVPIKVFANNNVGARRTRMTKYVASHVHVLMYFHDSIPYYYVMCWEQWITFCFISVKVIRNLI